MSRPIISDAKLISALSFFYGQLRAATQLPLHETAPAERRLQLVDDIANDLEEIIDQLTASVDGGAA